MGYLPQYIFRNAPQLKNITFKGRISDSDLDALYELQTDEGNAIEIDFSEARLSHFSLSYFNKLLGPTRVSISKSFVAELRRSSSMNHFTHLNLQIFSSSLDVVQSFSLSQLSEKSSLSVAYSRVGELDPNSLNGSSGMSSLEIEDSYFNLFDLSFSGIFRLGTIILRRNVIARAENTGLGEIYSNYTVIEGNTIECINQGSFIGVNSIRNFSFAQLEEANLVPEISNILDQDDPVDSGTMYCIHNASLAGATTLSKTRTSVPILTDFSISQSTMRVTSNNTMPTNPENASPDNTGNSPIATGGICEFLGHELSEFPESTFSESPIYVSKLFIFQLELLLEAWYALHSLHS